MFVELETRCAQSDEERLEGTIRLNDRMARIHDFIESISHIPEINGGERDRMIDLFTQVAYIFTLPLLKKIATDILSSIRVGDRRRAIIISACAVAKGLDLETTKLIANDSDWCVWIESL